MLQPVDYRSQPLCTDATRITVKWRPVLSALHSISFVDSRRRCPSKAKDINFCFTACRRGAAPPSDDKPIQFCVACSFALRSRWLDSIGLKLLNDSVGR